MHKYHEIIWFLQQDTYVWTPHHIFEDTVMTDKLNTLSHPALQLSTFSTCQYKYSTLNSVSQNPAMLFLANIMWSLHDTQAWNKFRYVPVIKGATANTNYWNKQSTTTKMQPIL
jgi:hypothetical protein